MTSAQTMLKRRRSSGGTPILVSALALSLALLGGCRAKPELVPPEMVVSPYAADALLAVVPPRNESGAGFIDPDRVGDHIVSNLSQVRGLSALPLNRTIEAMRALQLPAVTTPMEARQLARAMGVDGIVVATITAWDPYDPPVFGLSLALFAEEPLGRGSLGPLSDPRLLSMQASDAGYTGAGAEEPASVESLHLDARSHDVLLALKRYAEGRKEAETALDWRIYTASMDLYTQFGVHQGVKGLMGQEWLRLARLAAQQE